MTEKEIHRKFAACANRNDFEGCLEALKELSAEAINRQDGDDYDMLIMGRTQGKGCYCYVNGVLTTLVDKYAKNYKYIVTSSLRGLPVSS